MLSPLRAPSYRAVLRVSGALRCFVPALLGRLSYGVVSLALVLSVTDTTGSYAAVGTVMALFGLTVTVFSPLRAALIDRHGLRRALLPMAALYALLLVCLTAAAWAPGAATWLLAALAAAAGACAPPLGPVMRALWSHLVADRELLQRAYSLDTVAEELIFLTGSLLLGALLLVAPPALGLAAAAVLILSGTVLLAASPAAHALGDAHTATEPPGVAPHDAVPHVAASEGAAPHAAGPAWEVRTRRAPRRRPPGAFLASVALSAATGLTLGSVALLSVAFAEQHGDAALVVWTEAAQAAGSALGGLVYGAVAWRARPSARMALLGVALAVGVGAAAAAPTVSALVAVLFVVGVFTAPLLTIAYLVADEAVTADYRTRAGTWVNTAFNAGASAGGAGAGLLMAWTSPATGFLAAAVPLLLVAAALSAVSPSGRTGWPGTR